MWGHQHSLQDAHSHLPLSSPGPLSVSMCFVEPVQAMLVRPHLSYIGWRQAMTRITRNGGLLEMWTTCLQLHFLGGARAFQDIAFRDDQ